RIIRLVVEGTRLAIEGKRDECVRVFTDLTTTETGFDDPEGIFFGARGFARVGARDEALAVLAHVVERGFYCTPILLRDPWLDSRRGEPRFKEIVARADARSREAEEAYRKAGGERLLGPANF